MTNVEASYQIIKEILSRRRYIFYGDLITTLSTKLNLSYVKKDNPISILEDMISQRIVKRKYNELGHVIMAND